ncbi:hypothetical protein [Candidatus Palauibacter sp.]|uniref:hypothetical protein n=1 Tax=Candidatus Palauibacter sp. TaxID=3101350 RepID=UPI003CC5DB27
MGGTLQKIKPLFAEEVPPRGAKPTGEVVPFAGRQSNVYRMRRTALDKVPLIADGLEKGETLETRESEQTWRTSTGRRLVHRGQGMWVDQNGERFRQSRTLDGRGQETGGLIFETVERVEEIEFIIERAPNGHNRLVTDFRPSADELARAEMAQRVKENERALARMLAEEGMTAADLVEAAKTVRADQSRSVPAGGDDPADPFTLEMVSPGRWRMPDGETVAGTRKQAAEILRSVYSMEPAA